MNIITGKFLKEMREKTGLSQSELAKLVGVSQAHIAKIENEKVNPRLSTVNNILFILQKRENTIKCKDIMNKNIVWVDINTPVKKAAELMKKFGISQMPVFNQGALVGSISETTIIKNFDKNIKKLFVKHVLDKPFPMVHESDSIDILPPLLEFYPAVLVTEEGKIKGIITKSDLLGIKNSAE